MKKLLATTLLIIHLFNLTGYPLLFQYLIASSAKQLTAKIDNNQYASSELTEIRVPLDVPYIGNWSEYERYDGEITINGTHHHYVKRKVKADTLYLLCLPNERSDKLDIAKNDFNKKVNDFDGNKKEDTVKKGNILNQFCAIQTDFQFISPEHIASKRKDTSITSIISGFQSVHGQPPELIS